MAVKFIKEFKNSITYKVLPPIEIAKRHIEHTVYKYTGKMKIFFILRPNAIISTTTHNVQK